MSFENAKENLKEFGKELGLEGLEFDENNTCILGIDDEFSLHLTYEPNSKRLYLYSPLLDGLPRDEKTRLRLYERLLEGSMLGGQMAGGGVGVAVKEELILMHCTLDMEHAVSSALRAFAPLYVETVEKWRKICSEISEGRDEGANAAKPAAQPLQGGKQGQGFIKI
ncbi:CesT family type III secretion system chaperone [Candidatus Protochlamydia phocaeensis]|uniref:CesT family type III secretion system chaperone n=1 Tax=Candidatus Protochlamydia phocaeensis TaxID=1414722 RepID=UPI00083972CB|nr:CesT family type III secretion system chaperone [Candidatus Protochlamydia phocaeensis]